MSKSVMSWLVAEGSDGVTRFFFVPFLAYQASSHGEGYFSGTAKRLFTNTAEIIFLLSVVQVVIIIICEIPQVHFPTHDVRHRPRNGNNAGVRELVLLSSPPSLPYY